MMFYFLNGKAKSITKQTNLPSNRKENTKVNRRKVVASHATGGPKRIVESGFGWEEWSERQPFNMRKALACPCPHF